MTDLIIKPKHSDFQDLSGKRYGRLLVISFNNIKKGHSLWNCICDCGCECIVQGSRMKAGKKSSCGCLMIETRCLPKRHGHCSKGKSTPEYAAWRAMINRTTNKKVDHYHNYGGRGITVCDKWINSFEAFYADMGKRPSDKHSIDRIDNSGNYEPSNCRWATKSQQARNTRAAKKIKLEGKVYTIVELAEISGVNYRTIKSRLELGWSALDSIRLEKNKHVRKSVYKAK